jgi:hypothetical protein
MSPLPIAFALLALLGVDPVKIYKKELGRIESRQKVYEAKGLDQDLRDAYQTYNAPWRQRGGPDAPKVIDYDFSGYADVYERWADYADEKGRLAGNLAAANNQKAAEKLVGTLLDVLGEIEKHDKAILAGKPKTRSIHDLVPGMKRYACWIHRDAIVAALGTLTEIKAQAVLSKTGWDKAAKWDRSHKSIRARVALIDASGAIVRQRAFLETLIRSEEPGIRIATYEALAGEKPDAATKTLLRVARDDDPCRAVREAARALLGEKPPAPAADGPTFGGIPILSKGVIVLLDCSFATVKPLDVELLKTRTWREWRSVAEKDRNWLSQADWMKTEAWTLVSALPATARFNLVLLNEGGRILPMVPKGTIPADRKGRKRAEAFIDGILPGGFASQVQGFWEASRLAGSAPYGTVAPESPAADTIVLCSNGTPRGGPLLYGPAIVDEFRRAYRFHRITVHTVRFDDASEPAEELMKGIAKATGGVSVHMTK